MSSGLFLMAANFCSGKEKGSQKASLALFISYERLQTNPIFWAHQENTHKNDPDNTPKNIPIFRDRYLQTRLLKIDIGFLLDKSTFEEEIPDSRYKIRVDENCDVSFLFLPLLLLFYGLPRFYARLHIEEDKDK